MIKIVIAFSIAASLLAQQDKGKEKPKAPVEKKTDEPKAAPKPAAEPSIPDDHQRDYYRADGLVQRATKAVEESSKILESSRKDLMDAGNVLMADCGPDHTPSEDGAKKSLGCVPKPKPASNPVAAK